MVIVIITAPILYMYFLSIACGVVCDPGYMFNSSQCSCILTDTCLANTPCANNGTCVLGSSSKRYTCNCTGTNFMGVNCSGENFNG